MSGFLVDGSIIYTDWDRTRYSKNLMSKLRGAYYGRHILRLYIVLSLDVSRGCFQTHIVKLLLQGF